MSRASPPYPISVPPGPSRRGLAPGDDFAHVHTRWLGTYGGAPGGTLHSGRALLALKRVSTMSPLRRRAAARKTGAPSCGDPRALPGVQSAFPSAAARYELRILYPTSRAMVARVFGCAPLSVARGGAAPQVRAVITHRFCFRCLLLLACRRHCAHCSHLHAAVDERCLSRSTLRILWFGICLIPAGSRHHIQCPW